jgi:hypothetical protein
MRNEFAVLEREFGEDSPLLKITMSESFPPLPKREIERKISHHERMADLETRLAKLEEKTPRVLEALANANRHEKAVLDLRAELNNWI